MATKSVNTEMIRISNPSEKLLDFVKKMEMRKYRTKMDMLLNKDKYLSQAIKV